MLQEFRKLFREVTHTEYQDGQVFRSGVAEKIFELAMDRGIALCNERDGITINSVKKSVKYGEYCDVLLEEFRDIE